MRFALIVQSPPATSGAALAFAAAALAAGHEIVRVFFLREGTRCAQQGAAAARWTQLAQSQALELSVCVSGAARRQLFDDVTVQAPLGAQPNIAPAFTIAGLGLLIDAITTADRVVTFL